MKEEEVFVKMPLFLIKQNTNKIVINSMIKHYETGLKNDILKKKKG